MATKEPELLFTSNTTWLESIDARLSESPEDLLSRLEEMLEKGETTLQDVASYLRDLNYHN